MLESPDVRSVVNVMDWSAASAPAPQGHVSPSCQRVELQYAMTAAHRYHGDALL